MAPEMLMTEKNRQNGNTPFPHDKSLDFYHLGALLFEMLCGLPPFYSEDKTKMYNDIVFTPMQYPAFLSDDCKDLLKGLLQKKASERLGYEGGAASIKKHPWCKDINWDKILKKECEPPFKPFQNRSNFDPLYTSMNPILDDEDVLMTLEELQQKPQSGEYLQEYERRMQLNDGSKLTRQHSIELYERENQTFRGYSFLIDGQNYCSGIHPILSLPMHEGFHMCSIEDSKDQSFNGFRSPIGELDLLSDNQKVSAFCQNPQMMNIDQETTTILHCQLKQEPSQYSLMTEGVQDLRSNIDNMENERSQKKKLMHDHLQKDTIPIKQKQLKEQKSGESLFNELISTFDYSHSKKEKVSGQANCKNNSLSTMSLLSMSQQNNNYLNQPLQDRNVFKGGIHTFREDQILSTTSLKGRIEYQKNTRKYSPEVDISKALKKANHKQINNDYNSAFKQGGKRNQLSTSNHTAADHLSTRGNSNNKKANQSQRKGNTIMSEYNQFGNTKNSSKVGSKKRGSDVGSIRAASPSEKSMIKVSTFKKGIVNQKQHYNSVLKPSTLGSVANSQTFQTGQLQTAQQLTSYPALKTTALYKTVQNQVNKKHNLSSKNDKSQYKASIDNEQLKIESKYQTLQELKLEANPSGHFVVQKITANELIGSFFVSPAFKGQLSNPIGDQSIAELLVNSSGGELSFEENSQEAMAALILNQSSESCCCSDDEFTQKINIFGSNPIHKQSHKNLTKLQQNTLAESINANSYKHKLNERNFLKGLEETKVTSQTGNLFSDHDILITEHVSREDEKFKSEEDIMNIRSDNPSILDQHYQMRNFNPLAQSIQLDKKSNGAFQIVGKSIQMPYRQLPSSQSQSHSMLNKTTPISPMRERTTGWSKLKERPNIKQSSNLAKLSILSQANVLNHLSITPKSGSAKGKDLIQNKLPLQGKIPPKK